MSEQNFNPEKNQIPPIPGTGNREYRPTGFESFQQQPRPPYNPYMPQPPKAESNPLGTTGFVLALISLFVGWIPYIGWLIWLLGLIFSAIGVNKRPRGLATAGLIITLGMLILLIVFIAILGLAFFSALFDAGPDTYPF